MLELMNVKFMHSCFSHLHSPLIFLPLRLMTPMGNSLRILGSCKPDCFNNWRATLIMLNQLFTLLNSVNRNIET